jgi:hypothetical protein
LLQLKSNIEASAAQNVIVEPIACTDTDTTLTLFDSTLGGNSGSSSLSRENAVASRGPTPSAADPSIVWSQSWGFSGLNVMKADVEGAELAVLPPGRDATTLRAISTRNLILRSRVQRQLANMGTSV